jgi:hypothetical protein
MRSCPELVILRRGVLFSNGQALCRRASFREAKRIGVSITAGPTPRCMRYTRGVPATVRDEVSRAGAGFKSLADIWSDEPNGE